MGHYRLLVGFDDAAQEWIAYDSYDSHGLTKGQPYAGIRLPYAEVTRDWPVFNRAYLLIYDEARAADVTGIVGADLDDAAMWARAVAAAEAGGRGQTGRCVRLVQPRYGPRRIGSLRRGRPRVRPVAPDRAAVADALVSVRAVPRDYETGRYDEIIALADATLRTAKHVEELFFWRGLAQQAKGDLPAAQASLERALELNPNYAEARAALTALTP